MRRAAPAHNSVSRQRLARSLTGGCPVPVVALPHRAQARGSPVGAEADPAYTRRGGRLQTDSPNRTTRVPAPVALPITRVVDQVCRDDADPGVLPGSFLLGRRGVWKSPSIKRELLRCRHGAGEPSRSLWLQPPSSSLPRATWNRTPKRARSRSRRARSPRRTSPSHRMARPSCSPCSVTCFDFR